MTSTADKPARQNGSSRKFTADIIKQLKEMTNAADEDIQMALQECNGDVNRAAMSIIDNPFQEVKNKKVKPKPAEKPAFKAPIRDFPQREKREYVPGAERPDRADRGDRETRGRGRDDYRGGRPGGRAGRGRGFRDGDASQTAGPGSRPVPATTAQPFSEATAAVPAQTEFYDQPAVPVPAPVQPPASPPRLPTATPAPGPGISWASKLKPSPAPVAQPEPEPEPAHAEVYPETDANDDWGIGQQQQDALDAIEQQHDPQPDDAFGNGFTHRGEPESAASWGPPAPGDGSAQWGAPQELNATTLDEAVAKSFDNVPAAIPTSMPAATSPSYNQHQPQTGNFDFSGMAASLNAAGYGSDPSKFGAVNLRKDAAQPASSVAFQQAAMQQPADYSNAFGGVFQQQAADMQPQLDESKPVGHVYGMPASVPGFGQFSQPQPAFQAQPYGVLGHDAQRKPSNNMGDYGVMHDVKKDKAGYGLPQQEGLSDKGGLEQQSGDDQQGGMPQQGAMQHQLHQEHQLHQDMQYGLHMQSPEMQMYMPQHRNASAQQQPSQQAAQQQGQSGQPLMGSQGGVGLQQPQSQAQMASFMPQQAGMPAYGNYGTPNMPYTGMPTFPGSSPYAGMPNYGMQYPPGAYPQYGYPQGQNYATQQPPAPYAAPSAYPGKPAYDGGYPQGAGGRNGGRRNKSKGFGRGAGAPHQQGMGGVLPNEPFNPNANPQSSYGYMDPSWRSYDTYKQDKSMPAAQQPQPQQYDSYSMQQGFQPAAYSANAYSSQQQFPTPAQYSTQWTAGQDKAGYAKNY